MESRSFISFDDSDLNLSDNSDQWGSDSEGETPSEIGDSRLLFNAMTRLILSRQL